MRFLYVLLKNIKLINERMSLLILGMKKKTLKKKSVDFHVLQLASLKVLLEKNHILGLGELSCKNI